MGKVILWELCKKFKFDHANKWYMHNPESVPKNETHKILWDFEMQTHHLISARRLDLVKVKKKKKKRSCRILGFVFPADHWINLKKIVKRDSYLDLAREVKNYGR